MPSEKALVEGPVIQLDASGEVALVHGGRSRRAIRAEIFRVKDHLMALTEGEKTSPFVHHDIVDGMYVRKMHIPKGTVVVGKIHLKPCINVVEQGDISVLTEFGSRRCGPGFMGVSGPGIQKLGFAHEDTIFVNIFRTDSQDLRQIEEEIACEAYELFPLEEEKEEAACLSVG